MELNDLDRERIDSALDRRVAEATGDGRTLSRSERIEHVTALLGLVHAAGGNAMTVLTERIRILAEHL